MDNVQVEEVTDALVERFVALTFEPCCEPYIQLPAHLRAFYRDPEVVKAFLAATSPLHDAQPTYRNVLRAQIAWLQAVRDLKLVDRLAQVKHADLLYFRKELDRQIEQKSHQLRMAKGLKAELRRNRRNQIFWRGYTNAHLYPFRGEVNNLEDFILARPLSLLMV